MKTLDIQYRQVQSINSDLGMSDIAIIRMDPVCHSPESGSMEFRTRIPQWETLWESALNIPAFSQKNRSFPNFFPIFLDNLFHSR